MRIRFPFLLYMLLCAEFASAGWTSGGGLIDHSHANPWFLSNTKTVSYCIKVDRQHVTVDAATVRINFERALSYWQGQFKDAFELGQVEGFPFQTPIATQQFNYVDCSNRSIEQARRLVDVVVQVGTLSRKQRRYLKNPKKFIAIAVRTDYDPAKLRGKGFIYLSADAGPLRYEGDHLVDHAWSKNRNHRLYKVLAHELGHIFGIQHEGNFLDTMSAEFPYFILWDMMRDFAVEMALFSHFSLWMGRIKDPFPPYESVCRESGFEGFNRFFEIPAEHKCFELDISSTKFQVFSKATQSEQLTLAGEAKLSDLHQNFGPTSVRIGVTDKQSLFPPVFNLVKVVIGAFSVSHKWKGEYVATNGKKKGMILQVKPFDIEISGIDGDDIIIDVFDAVTKRLSHARSYLKNDSVRYRGE